MLRQTALLIAAALIALPLQAQQDSTRRNSDLLVARLRPIVRNRTQIRVIQSEGSFVVEQPSRWLDTLRRPELIRAVQVRGNSAETGAMIGGLIGLAAGAIAGTLAGVQLGGDFGTSTGGTGMLGGVAVGAGGALVGMGIGALIGLGTPRWHTRVTVRPKGRIVVR
jgi:hypothetical protein